MRRRCGGGGLKGGKYYAGVCECRRVEGGIENIEGLGRWRWGKGR